MLQFLPYALAAYGGYKGYQSSKQAGGSGIQRKWKQGKRKIWEVGCAL